MLRKVEDLAPMVSLEILSVELTNIASAALLQNQLQRLIGLSVLMREVTVLVKPTSGTVPKDPTVNQTRREVIPKRKELLLENNAPTANSEILYVEQKKHASAVKIFSIHGKPEKSSTQTLDLPFGDQEMDTGITRV